MAQVKRYCEWCRHWARREGRSHLYNVRLAPTVTIDIEDLVSEYCDHCRRSYLSKQAVKATVRAVMEKLLATRPALPAMPRATLRGIVEKLLAALSDISGTG